MYAIVNIFIHGIVDISFDRTKLYCNMSYLKFYYKKRKNGF